MVREVAIPPGEVRADAASLRACVATILELAYEDVPPPATGEDPAGGWTVSRWLGGLGLGLARVADPGSFSWPGPWIAAVHPPQAGPRFVVMYGVPSGVIWDPAGGCEITLDSIADGYLIAASDVALAPPPRPDAPHTSGTLEAICTFPEPGQPARMHESIRAIAGRGLDGDRYLSGSGTFPSGPPGSALTLIEAEVCESFDPALEPGEHRRNLITRGIELNALVGHDFMVGGVRCRGMRLCEPCTVVDRYASRPVLRALVHRGGLRADILQDGQLILGDRVGAVPGGSADERHGTPT
jgi:hypothetical protein